MSAFRSRRAQSPVHISFPSDAWRMEQRHSFPMQELTETLAVKLLGACVRFASVIV